MSTQYAHSQPDVRSGPFRSNKLSPISLPTQRQQLASLVQLCTGPPRQQVSTAAPAGQGWEVPHCGQPRKLPGWLSLSGAGKKSLFQRRASPPGHPKTHSYSPQVPLGERASGRSPAFAQASLRLITLSQLPKCSLSPPSNPITPSGDSPQGPRRAPLEVSL